MRREPFSPPPSPASAPTAARGGALSGVAFVFLADALILPTGLLTTGFLTRTLGPEDYGRFTLAASMVAWAQWSIVSLFSRTAIRFTAESIDWQPVATTALRVYLLAGLVGGVMFAAGSDWLASALLEPELGWYLLWLAVDVPLFCATQAHLAVLVGIGRFRERAAATAVRWLSRLALMLILVGAGFSVGGAIAANIGASCVELIACRRWIQPSPLRREAFPLRRMWDLAWPLMLFALSMRLFDRLDLVLLKRLGGTAAEVGFYGAAQNLMLVPMMFGAAVSTAVLSTLSAMLRDGEGESARKLAGNAMRAAIAMLPFAALVAGCAGELVRLVFGADFAPSAPLLAWLIFGGVGIATIAVANGLLVAFDRPRSSAINVVPLLALAVVAHSLAIPAFGPPGAAAVTTTLAVLGAAAAIFLVGRGCEMAPPWASLARSLAVALAIYGLAQLWPASGIGSIFKMSVLGLLVPLGLLVLGELDVSERKTLLGQVRQWI